MLYCSSWTKARFVHYICHLNGQPTWFSMTPPLLPMYANHSFNRNWLADIPHFFGFMLLFFFFFGVAHFNFVIVPFHFFFFLLFFMILVLLAWLLLFDVRFYSLAISLKAGGDVLRRWRQKDWRRKALIIDLFFFLFFFFFFRFLLFFGIFFTLTLCVCDV